MKTKSALSSSGMFLCELLIAILVFAVAAAVCVRIFVFANFTATDSSTLNHAVIAAQNGAECFKATGGDLSEAAKLLGTAGNGNAITIYMDQNWKSTNDENAPYLVTVERTSRQVGCVNGEVTVSENAGDPLYVLTVSAEEKAAEAEEVNP